MAAGLIAIPAVLVLPILIRRSARLSDVSWVADLVDGVDGARHAILSIELAPDWRTRIPWARHRRPGRFVRGHRTHDPGRAARPRIPDRLSRKPDPGPRRLRRTRGRARRRADRLRRSGHPGCRGGHRLSRDRVLDPEPGRHRRLLAPATAPSADGCSAGGSCSHERPSRADGDRSGELIRALYAVDRVREIAPAGAYRPGLQHDRPAADGALEPVELRRLELD